MKDNSSKKIEKENKSIEVEAIFSKDKKYRYFLKKTWNMNNKNIAFLMLNPSKADTLKSDNTVTNATNFAVEKDFGSITIVNLFADMGTDSKCLTNRDTSSDDLNDEYILNALKECDEFVIAWERRIKKKRKRKVAKILNKFPNKLKCFVEYDDDGNEMRRVNHLRIYKTKWKYESWNLDKDLENELS